MAGDAVAAQQPLRRNRILRGWRNVLLGRGARLRRPAGIGRRRDDDDPDGRGGDPGACGALHGRALLLCGGSSGPHAATARPPSRLAILRPAGAQAVREAVVPFVAGVLEQIVRLVPVERHRHFQVSV